MTQNNSAISPKAPIVPSSPYTLGEGFVLAMIVLGATVLRLWKLGQNSFGNTYYTAAARSMSQSWHNFIFASFDPAGYVTVDKPPVALWAQVASVKILGFSIFSVLFPQVLEGLLSVVLVYYLVRRRFDAWAALLAALTMAVGPICVALDRFNNVDTCLVTILLLATWAILLATEKSKLSLLLLSMVLVGIGFNTKMVVAFIVLPAFYLLYFSGASGSWRKRLLHLILASVILATVALSWPLFVDLTPPDGRPFVGSTQDNSVISLSLGWNGLQRILSRRRNPMGRELEGTASVAPTPVTTATPPRNPANRNFNRRNGFMGARPGLFRLADKQMSGQILWFLPLALVGFLVALQQSGWSWPLSLMNQSLWLWLGWFLSYALVFTFMNGGVHTYYLVMLAPPLSALAGIGTRAIWLAFKQGKWRLMPLSLLLAATWQAYTLIQYPSWAKWMLPTLIMGTAISVASIIWLVKHRGSEGSLSAAFSVGLAILFLCPVSWSLVPLMAQHASADANPDQLYQDQAQNNAPGLGFFGNMDMNNEKLLKFLQSHRHGEKLLLVAQNAQTVAPIIIKTGEPAVSLGGFMGRDPVVTLEQFLQMVKTKQFRYILLAGVDRNNRPENQNAPQPSQNIQNNWGWTGIPNGSSADIANWVRKYGKPVDPKLWRSAEENARIAALLKEAPAIPPDQPNGFRNGRRGRGMQLYDLAGLPDRAFLRLKH